VSDVTKETKVIEWVKTALIALLAMSALILAWRTELFSGVLDNIPFFGSVAELVRGTSTTTEMIGAELIEAARPLSIVITNEDGGRYGVKYDTVERNAVYDRTSSILGEALGSASAPAVISEEEWRKALSGPGVFFEYISPVKLSILDRWLGARIPDNAQDIVIRYVFIAFGMDKSRIYYQDIERGLFFGADTASAAGKAQVLEIYDANGAVFAFETGNAAAENTPYMLIMQETDHPDVSADPAGSAEELLDITIVALGHQEEKNTTYYDNKDALVCVGTQFNVSVYSDGRIFYRRTSELPLIDDDQIPDISGMIEQARVIVAETIGKTCGDAEVFFEFVEYSADGSCSVIFNYFIAGGRIFLYEDNNAARIKFSSGTVLEVELFFRNYSLSDVNTDLLPEKLALAAAGGEFILSYSDAGPETLQPSWVKY
jgi:hypothetical protein